MRFVVTWTVELDADDADDAIRGACQRIRKLTPEATVTATQAYNRAGELMRPVYVKRAS